MTFTQSDVCQLPGDKPFDAVVGRFILQFLPDPVAALGSLSQLVRPGHLPLWTACASLVWESLHRCSGNTEMGLALYHTFQRAGLTAPNLQLEIPLGDDPGFARWIYDLFARCCRKSGDSISPLRIWAIWILSRKGSNRRWPCRKILFQAWPWSGPCAAGRQTVLTAIVSPSKRAPFWEGATQVPHIRTRRHL